MCAAAQARRRHPRSACRKFGRVPVDEAKAWPDDGHHDGVNETLLDLDNDVHNHHAHKDARPRDGGNAIGHVEEPLEARHIGDEDLHASRQGHGQKDDIVALEHARVERRHLDEACRETVANLTKHEHVERLSARLVEADPVIPLRVCGVVIRQRVERPCVHAEHQDNEQRAHKHTAPQHELAEKALADATWRTVHDARLRRLHSERHAHGASRYDVHVQHLDGRQRRVLEADDVAPPDGEALREVDRQVEDEQLAQVVPHAAALAHGDDDRRKVVVSKHHLCGLLGHLRAGDAHRNTAVGSLERGRVVHAVTCHSDNVARARRYKRIRRLLAAVRDARRNCRFLKHLASALELLGRPIVVVLVAVKRTERANALLQCLDNAQLVLRRRTCKDVAVVDHLLKQDRAGG
eukprot:364199-Chlamydomonas_euryale.AAC.17